MKYLIILALMLCANRQGYSQEQIPETGFSDVIVKKKINGKICDSCRAVSVVTKEYDFNYVITGAGHTPHRFGRLKGSFSYGPSRPRAPLVSAYVISQRNIGISFLPNFLQENGNKIQLYRNFGGPDYTKLEFRAEQNGKVIKPWMPLSALGENSNYAILGINFPEDKFIPVLWKRTFYAGDFNLDIMDSLKVTVREITTKKLLQRISILRAADTANNFIYYQLPLGDGGLNANLQDILNLGRGEPVAFGGDTSTIFKKDYGSIGILLYKGLTFQDEVEYSFGKNPYKWKSLTALDPGHGVFLVLPSDMTAGKDHDIYLRYKSQPETVHSITVSVKPPPFEIPWAQIAVISILILTLGLTWFYLRNKRNKRKLAALKQKNEDTETRLSLLSGQLNPHFLFNSLNAIQGTINNNQEKANAYIASVASFMRDVMDNSKKEFVSLQEELKQEEDYLKLEQERSAFSYTISVSTDLRPSLIDFPPLLLQPVLENSIRHAFGQNLSDPTITIQIFRDTNNLNVKLADNGITFWNSDGVQQGHGLSLTRKRIAVYNEKLEGMSIQMNVNYSEGSGTITTFTLQNWLS
ncbi:histidine kinase [Arcticibacter tournemirensis]|nr:histidine kinase [Arcticibacter tournemirensis]TQM50722.1 histidine kinase [Arcticibacter tournemirensis]